MSITVKELKELIKDEDDDKEICLENKEFLRLKEGELILFDDYDLVAFLTE